MEESYGPIVVEDSYNNISVERVWKAITDINDMKRWYFENIPDFKPEVGFETEFYVYGEKGRYLHKWKVTEVWPERKISYNWKYDGYEGDSNVTFELHGSNTYTHIVVTHDGMGSFTQDVPEFREDSCYAGWNYFINGKLKRYLMDERQ